MQSNSVPNISGQKITLNSVLRFIFLALPGLFILLPSTGSFIYYAMMNMSHGYDGNVMDDLTSPGLLSAGSLILILIGTGKGKQWLYGPVIILIPIALFLSRALLVQTRSYAVGVIILLIQLIGVSYLGRKVKQFYARKEERADAKGH